MGFTVLHRLLTQDVMSMSLLVAWAALHWYINSNMKLEFTYISGTNHGILTYGYGISDTVTMGHVMMTAPIFLLLETMELQGGEWHSRAYLDYGSSLCGPCSYFSASLLLQLTEGHPKSQWLIEWLDIVLQFTRAIPWVLLYVVVLVMTLSRNYKNPYYALHLCYLIIFFLHHFLTTLPTWVSSVANVRKIVCGAVLLYWK